MYEFLKGGGLYLYRNNYGESFLEELTVEKNFYSKRISSWDTTGKNYDWLYIPPKEKAILAAIDGSGCIKHFYCVTLSYDPFYYRNVVLRMYWDEEKNPSVEVPLGDFFGIGHCKPRLFSSLMLSVNPGNPLPGGPLFTYGINCYFPMPFSKSAKVEIENQSDIPIEAFWYHINYQEYKRLDDNIYRFHASWNREITKVEGKSAKVKNDPHDLDGVNLTGEENYTILDAQGNGQLIGILLNVDNIAGTNKYGSVNLFLNRWGDPDFWTDWRFSAYRRLLSGIFNHELGHGVDYSGFYPEIDGLFYYLHKISGLDEDNYAEFHSHYVSSPGEDFAETYAQWQSKDGDPSINLFNTAVDLAQTGKAILLEKLLFIMRFFIHQNGPEKSVYFYISTQDDYTAELRPVTMDTLGRITSVNTGDRIIYFTYNNENRLIDVRISYPIYEHDTNLFGDSRVYNVKIFDNGWVRIETPDLKIIEGHLDDYLEFSPSVYWKVSVRGDGSVESLRIYQEKSGGKCLISKRLFNSNNKLIAHFKKMGLSYVEAIIKDYDTKAKTRITIHSQNPGDLIEDLDLDNIDNYQHEEKVVYLYEDSLPFDEIPITSGTDAQWALDRPIITLYYKDGEIKSWHCEVFPEGVFIVQSGADIAELLTDVSGRNPDNINSLIQNGDDIKITLDQTITLPAREVTYDYDCQRGILRFMDTNTWETVAEVEYPEVTVVTIDDRDYEIRITDGIFELEAMFNPFTIEVSTNPYGNKNLTINVDGDYNATVVWSGRTYEAKFAPDAMTIIITNPYQWSTNTEWVFKFNDTPAGYLLESLEMTHESPYGKSITLYKFSEERMEFIDHRHESDNYNSLSHTSYFYDIINEKTLISAIDSYYHYESSYNGIIHTGEGRYKTYYAYDQNGDRTATVHVGNYAYDGRTNRYASYTLFSTDDNTITTVYVYDVDPILLDSINSPSDYEIIDQYAHTKTVAFYEDPSFRWNKRKFSIEYARNTEGEFIAKKVYDKNYQTYIVIGDPDIQSGETSDILIKNWQKVLDDYNVTYGRAYSYDSETGQREYLGYGLVFSKWVESDNGKWKQVSVVVDYPKDDRITLDDKEYLIEIDQNGCVKLTEYIILFEPTAYSLWIDAWRYYKQRKSLIDLLYSDDSEENYLTLKYNIPLVQ